MYRVADYDLSLWDSRFHCFGLFIAIQSGCNQPQPTKNSFYTIQAICHIAAETVICTAVSKYFDSISPFGQQTLNVKLSKTSIDKLDWLWILFPIRSEYHFERTTKPRLIGSTRSPNPIVRFLRWLWTFSQVERMGNKTNAVAHWNNRGLSQTNGPGVQDYSYGLGWSRTKYLNDEVQMDMSRFFINQLTGILGILIHLYKIIQFSLPDYILIGWQGEEHHSGGNQQRNFR